MRKYGASVLSLSVLGVLGYLGRRLIKVTNDKLL